GLSNPSEEVTIGGQLFPSYPKIQQSINPSVSRMTIGVPKEIKGQEYRVALLPSAAYQLIKRGHQVMVERDAGAGAGYPNADYEQAGATVVSEHAAVCEKAALVVNVKEP